MSGRAVTASYGRMAFYYILRACVLDIDEPALTPARYYLGRPAIGARHRRPRHERRHVRIARGMKNRDTTAARMSEQSIAAIDPVVHLTLSDHSFEIAELLEVRIVSERILVREILAVLSDAAAGHIERDRTKTGICDLLGQIGKE